MATLQTLPLEIRLQIYSSTLSLLSPDSPSQRDQICATLDCFCGHRHRAFASQLLPLLLSSKHIYADVSSLLLSPSPEGEKKRTLAFCSPGCAAAVIPKLGRLQVRMVGELEVHTAGVWGVPVEAVMGIKNGILKVLGEMEMDVERDGGHAVRGPMNGDGEEVVPLWESRFQGGGMSWGLERWMLVFSRVSQGRKALCPA